MHLTDHDLLLLLRSLQRNYDRTTEDQQIRLVEKITAELAQRRDRQHRGQR